MTYHIKTKGYTDTQDLADPSIGTKPFRTIGAAIEQILDMLEYQQGDIAEVLICNELGTACYSIQPTGNRQFHLKELF